MPSRLASDRPIKNVIGSVNQTLLQRRGWARQVGGRQWQGREGRLDNGSSADRWREKERGVSLRCTNTHSSFFAHCPEALGNSYKGVQLLCFVVCLYRGRGDDDLSLFVGISGSVMWL